MVIAALLAILGAIQAQNAGMSGMATTAMMLGAPAVLAAVIAEISRRNGGTTVWQWVLSFIPLVLMLAAAAVFLQALE